MQLGTFAHNLDVCAINITVGRHIKNFDLSSNKTPPTVLELKPNSSGKMFVFADKTRNIYETSLVT